MTKRFVHFQDHNAFRIGLEDEADPGVLLVGEVNPLSTDPRQALWPSPSRSSGRRLQSTILGLSHQAYYGLWRTNLCQGHWKRDMAEVNARWLIPTKYEQPRSWNTIILLGRKVASVFEVVLGVKLPMWSWCPYVIENARDDNPDIVCIPHPSGLTRDWNEPANIDRARTMLRAIAPRVPWGELGVIPVADE